MKSFAPAISIILRRTIIRHRFRRLLAVGLFKEGHQWETLPAE
jgi:hypothetical protein